MSYKTSLLISLQTMLPKLSWSFSPLSFIILIVSWNVQQFLTQKAKNYAVISYFSIKTQLSSICSNVIH